MKEISTIQTKIQEQDFNFFIEDYQILLESISSIIDVLEKRGENIQQHENLDGLITKFFLTGCSIKMLFDGTTIEIRSKGKKDRYFDISSCMTLIRNQIESYVFFDYLFLQPETDAEREFRNILFQAAGLKRRQEFNVNYEGSIEQINQEKKIIDSLIEQIERNSYFQTLTKKQRDKIKKNLPEKVSMGEKLFLEESIKKNRFRNYFFNSWKLYSNHTHSEHLGLLQITEYAKNPEKLTKNKLIFCVDMCILTSIFIKNLMNIFTLIPESNNLLEKINEYYKIPVSYEEKIKRQKEESI
ncbi:MAG: hypothetical protein MUC49_13415 [Raineya sp.]|jgi:hypothetical protein|nr:hypothetical protein [Raineya sp.]